MGTIVITEFVSLDGVMQAPAGEDFKYRDWSFKFDRGDDGDKFKLDEALGSEALLLGRVTYEGFAAAWPSREGEFADKCNSMPKYVVSADSRGAGVEQLHSAEWGSRRGGQEAQAGARRRHLRSRQSPARPDADRERPRRRAAPDGVPVVLGTGRRLFGETSDEKPMRLVDSTTVGEDIAILTLQPASD